MNTQNVTPMQQPGFKYAQAADDYRRVERAIAFLEDHFQEQPSLARIASSAGLSEFHFQRLFSRWVGISPKRFLQYITKEYAKGLLERSSNLLDVSFEAGLSGPSRLHDLFVVTEAVTPGEYKARGSGLTIRYGFHASPFGEVLLAVTERGLCGLVFVDETGRRVALEILRTDWKQAQFREDAPGTRPFVQAIFGPRGKGAKPMHLFLRGTNFQIKVWEALLLVPSGRVVTYSQIAEHVGSPRAVRAVGTAVGVNPIPFLIPCHRVIRKLGEMGGYRYGVPRKRAILAWEAARAS